MRGACLIVIITYLHTSTSLYYWCADDLKICFYTNGTSYSLKLSEAQQTCRRNESILLAFYNYSYELAFENALHSWKFRDAYLFWLNLGLMNGTYKWLNSNTQPYYTKWQMGEPSWNSSCICLFIPYTGFNYKWKPQDCLSKLPFVCLQALPSTSSESLSSKATTAMSTDPSVSNPISDKSSVKADGAARDLSESPNVALAVALPLTIIFIVLALAVVIVWMQLKRQQWLNGLDGNKIIIKTPLM